MGIITTEMNWRLEDLALLYDPVEIEDAHGKLIGVFIPGNLERCREEYARQMAMVSEEELDRRETECSGGYTYEEVKAYLRALEEEEERRERPNRPEAPCGIW